jgi:hypothetical protein
MPSSVTRSKLRPAGRPSLRAWRWDFAVRQTDAEQRVDYEVLGTSAEFWVPGQGLDAQLRLCLLQRLLQREGEKQLQGSPAAVG